jgi:hypothetical protein
MRLGLFRGEVSEDFDLYSATFIELMVLMGLKEVLEIRDGEFLN